MLMLAAAFGVLLVIEVFLLTSLSSKELAKNK